MEKNNQDRLLAQLRWDQLKIEDEPIGEGAFGEVYRGRLAEQNVAVKKFKSRFMSDKERADVIIKEINTLRQLNHKRVVIAMGPARDPKGRIYLVMEYAKNGSLYDLLHREKKILNVKEVLQIGLDVAKGLAYLHSNSPTILHRDIKSANILLFNNKTRAKISDFGNARLLEDDQFSRTISNIGTLGYMAPEILDQQPYNEKVDVYGFGVVLFEMLHKSLLPTTWKPRQDKIEEMVKNKALRLLILSCCEHEPKNRPSMNQVVVDLKAILKTVKEEASQDIANLELDSLKVKFDSLEKNYAKTLQLSGVAILQGNFESALEFLTKSDQLQPNDASTLLHRAIAKINLLDHVGALQDITKAMKLSPTTECITWKDRIVALNSALQGTRKIQYSEFKILFCLGKGFFNGEVFLAEWHGIKVALKIHSWPAHSIKAEAWRSLHHNHIVKNLGVVLDPNGNTVIIMEYMKDGSLQDFIFKSNELSHSCIVRLALDIARGLNYLHLQDPKFTHTSIRSSNIMLYRGKQRAKISDLNEPPPVFFDAIIEGRVEEVAPEIMWEKTYDNKADVYSFGVTLYTMLTKRLFPLLNNPQQHIVDTISDHKFRKLVLDCCSLDANDRPHMAQVVETLKLMKNSAV